MKRISAVARTVVIALAILSLTSGATMQSGGGFEITEAVVASGGESLSAGDIVVDATLGQSMSGGAIQGDIFSVTSGFWTYTPLAPTAAQASISGRVINSAGIGISNAILFAQLQDGSIVATRGSSFGHYLFEGIEVGQGVFITVEHKRFTFEPRFVMVADNVTDLDFVAR